MGLLKEAQKGSQKRQKARRETRAERRGYQSRRESRRRRRPTSEQGSQARRAAGLRRDRGRDDPVFARVRAWTSRDHPRAGGTIARLRPRIRNGIRGRDHRGLYGPSDTVDPDKRNQYRNQRPRMASSRGARRGGPPIPEYEKARGRVAMIRPLALAERNRAPIDIWTAVHFATGCLAARLGITLPVTLIAGAIYEWTEPSFDFEALRRGFLPGNLQARKHTEPDRGSGSAGLRLEPVHREHLRPMIEWMRQNPLSTALAAGIVLWIALPDPGPETTPDHNDEARAGGS